MSGNFSFEDSFLISFFKALTCQLTCFIIVLGTMWSKNPIEGEFTKAGPNNYTLHKQCFKCAKCGKPFDVSTGFTEDDDGKLLHLECYTADM